EELRVARQQLVQLELVALGAAVELERPAAAVEGLAAARILDDSVERDELGHDQLAHRFLLSSRFPLGRRPRMTKLIATLDGWPWVSRSGTTCSRPRRSHMWPRSRRAMPGSPNSHKSWTRASATRSPRRA